MKRTPLLRKTQLKTNRETTRAFIQRGRGSLQCNKPREPKQRLKRSSLNPVSAKQKVRNRKWDTVAAAHKKLFPFCARCQSHGLEIPVQETHHLDGKEGEQLTDTERLISVCKPCHDWIHNNPAQARTEGFLGTKHTKIRGTTEAD